MFPAWWGIGVRRMRPEIAEEPEAHGRSSRVSTRGDWLGVEKLELEVAWQIEGTSNG